MYPLHSVEEASAADTGAGDATHNAIVSSDESPRTAPTLRRRINILSTTEKNVVAHGAHRRARATVCDRPLLSMMLSTFSSPF
jgi:hypothetical protein